MRSSIIPKNGVNFNINFITVKFKLVYLFKIYDFNSFGEFLHTKLNP